jgi:hypothetical protein
MTSKQSVSFSSFNIYSPETLDKIFDWCLKFHNPPPPEDGAL